MDIGLVRTADEVAKPAGTYVDAMIVPPTHRTEELHDTPTGVLSELAETVVSVEGPVHVDEGIDHGG